MTLIIVLIVAYLIGSIPFGYLIVRTKEGGDIRQTGSGGTGATNVSRRAGKAAGVLTLLLDASKGAAAVLIAQNVSGTDWVKAAAAIAVIAGRRRFFRTRSGRAAVRRRHLRQHCFLYALRVVGIDHGSGTDPITRLVAECICRARRGFATVADGRGGRRTADHRCTPREY
jgi:hypothetical protein